jgi:hypothetical protein
LKLENLGGNSFVPKPNVQNQIDFFVSSMVTSAVQTYGKFNIEEIFQKFFSLKKEVSSEKTKIEEITKKRLYDYVDFFRNFVN